MQSSKDTLNWVDKAVSIWTTSNIKLQEGVSSFNILEIEKLLNFNLPQDFIELYKKVDGFKDFDWNKHMFSLWPLNRILKEYCENGDSNYIGFCDYLINSHSIGFYKSDNRTYKYYNKPEPIADTFKKQ